MPACFAINPYDCNRCGKCMTVCDDQGGQAIHSVLSCGDTSSNHCLEITINESECLNCGLCVTVCPTGAAYQLCVP